MTAFAVRNRSRTSGAQRHVTQKRKATVPWQQLWDEASGLADDGTLAVAA